MIALDFLTNTRELTKNDCDEMFNIVTSRSTISKVPSADVTR
jgi:hypothetical protein